MFDPAISVIVNAHREGLLAVATLRSVEQAIANAEREGIVVETICVLDRGDAETRDVFMQWVASRSMTTLIQIESGDLGIARNHGVACARGKWVALLDADDLWSENWLTAAYRAAEAESRLTVWHPQANLYFGVTPHIFIHIDMDDLDFDIAAVAQTNLWTSLCFAERNLFSTVPFRPTDFERQIGYEDWDWHIQTIARGAIHKTVSGTAHAIRTKVSSLVKNTTAAQCLPHSTDLFRTILIERQRDAARASLVDPAVRQDAEGPF